MNQKTVRAFRASRLARGMDREEPKTALDLARELQALWNEGQVTSKATMTRAMIEGLVQILEGEGNV